MNNIFFYHHLGIGDHIICKGLIKNLAKKYENNKLFLVCKSGNYNTIKRLYDDFQQINLLPIIEENFNNSKLLKIGFERWKPLCDSGKAKTFDEAFYVQCEIDYLERWNSFSINRNLKKEKIISKILNPSGNPYIFVHDNPSLGFNISLNHSNVIRNNPKICIFDMIDFLENASEIHCMESSFKCLIDQIENISCPLFLHSKVRSDGHGSLIVSGTRKEWKII